MSMDVAPASSAFSTSSFTTEAGRSTTSPAAIWSATALGRIAMRDVISLELLIDRRPSLERREIRGLDPSCPLFVERYKRPRSLPAHGPRDLTNDCGSLRLAAESGIAAQSGGRAKNRQVARGKPLVEIEPAQKQQDAHDSRGIR